MRPSVSAASDLRDLLGYQHDTLVRGLMLLTPGERARLGLALAAADWPGMSLITNLEAEAEKIFREVETKVEEFDGQALAEARRLLADAKAAEQKVLSAIVTDKAALLALVEKYGPELVTAVEDILKNLLVNVQGLFGTAPE